MKAESPVVWFSLKRLHLPHMTCRDIQWSTSPKSHTQQLIQPVSWKTLPASITVYHRIFISQVDKQVYSHQQTPGQAWKDHRDEWRESSSCSQFSAITEILAKGKSMQTFLSYQSKCRFDSPHPLLDAIYRDLYWLWVMLIRMTKVCFTMTLFSVCRDYREGKTIDAVC